MKRKESLVKKNYAILNYIKSLNQRQRIKFLEHCPKHILHTFAELALNLISSRVKIKPEQLVKLKKYKFEIYKISQKTTSDKYRRSILAKKGGMISGLLQLILPSILGILVDKISHGRKNVSAK